MSAAVELERISLSLGAFALRDISFALDSGDIFVILGPSGAGKSVLLETIAGFYPPKSGTIKIGGRDVTSAPPEARRIGFMFQDYALFPHLTVAQNVQFARPNGDPAHSRDLLARLGLAALANRHPANLSGGEKQRVALTRALAMNPALFLFDEPLSALDAPTRDALRAELKSLLRQLGLPAIYVTHDQAEALVLADKMAILRDGELLQVGTPAEIFNAPASEFVANFVGIETVLKGETLAVSDGDARVALGSCEIHAAASRATRRVLVCIRPEDVALSRAPGAGSGARNRFDARVVEVAALAHLFKITLDCGFPLVAYITKQTYLELGIAPGARLTASVEAADVHLIPQE